ncbi:MAG: FkbM family methyltransferase [Solirubrobacteraceae bacterium]
MPDLEVGAAPVTAPASGFRTVEATRLPRALRAWSRIGRRVPIATRLRVTGRLSARLVASGQTYLGPGGIAFSIDHDDPFQATMLVGLYDPLVEAVLRRYTPPGGIVIDAGAHLGYFSLRVGRWVGPTGSVHAFECDPRLVPRLRHHVEINGLDWVIVNDLGLADHSGQASLSLPNQLGWASTIEGAWGASQATAVTMTTLDEYAVANGLAPEQISFIKLDVEGSELQAIRGARNLLAVTSAPVLVEFVPWRMRLQQQDPTDLLTLMNELGFDPWAPSWTRDGRLRLRPGADSALGEDVLFLKRT